MEFINKIREKIGFDKLFFLITLLIALTIFVLNNELFFSFLNNFIKIILNVYWIIIIVFVLTFLINLLLSEKKIIKYLGKESGNKGRILALFGGLISHGPIYLWYPLLSELKEKGMKNELISIFLYNRAVKIPLLPLMFFYFGLIFTILLTILTIIFSFINAYILERILNENSNK
jgi:uncharacterized membrane protein YraQ (UPF0718 family)